MKLPIIGYTLHLATMVIMHISFQTEVAPADMGAAPIITDMSSTVRDEVRDEPFTRPDAAQPSANADGHMQSML